MKTNTLDIDRRDFMKKTGGSLLAATVGSSLALSAVKAHAASSAVTQTKQTQSAITPQKALQMLKDGNSRFVQGKMLRRNLMQQVKATGSGQFPFAAIVGCIDSRVSNELIFDQGIGDIFSARIAGNFVNDDILGSLEFACAAVGAKLILVLGRIAAQTLLKSDLPLTNLRKKLQNYQGIPMIVTYHPAALLRNPQWKYPTWDDVRFLKSVYKAIVNGEDPKLVRFEQ